MRGALASNLSEKLETPREISGNHFQYLNFCQEPIYTEVLTTIDHLWCLKKIFQGFLNKPFLTISHTHLCLISGSVRPPALRSSAVLLHHRAQVVIIINTIIILSSTHSHNIVQLLPPCAGHT